MTPETKELIATLAMFVGFVTIMASMFALWVMLP